MARYGTHQCPTCMDCSDFDADLFFGICPDCWLDLEPYQRTILQGKEPLVTTVTVTRLPPKPGWFQNLCATVVALVPGLVEMAILAFVIWLILKN